MRNAEAVDDMPGTHDADGQAARPGSRGHGESSAMARSQTLLGLHEARAAALVDLLARGVLAITAASQ